MSPSTSAHVAARPIEWGGLLVLPPLLLLVGVFYYPLALILGQSLTGDGTAVSFAAYASLLSGTLFQSAFLHTVMISLGATAGCLLLGFTLAVVLAFVPFPGSRLAARVIDTVIALPTFLVALA